MFREVKTYKYFDTPDGEDVLQKLVAVLKPTSLVALGLSTIDVMLYSHPKGYLQTLGRYAYISAPILGMATVFVATTNMLTNLRKEDDRVNWMAGGAAAGAVVGVWRKSPQIGFAAAAAFAGVAAGKKFCVQNGYEMFPEPKHRVHGTLKSIRNDWSLIKDRPGNWTTGKEE